MEERNRRKLTENVTWFREENEEEEDEQKQKKVETWSAEQVYCQAISS